MREVFLGGLTLHQIAQSLRTLIHALVVLVIISSAIESAAGQSYHPVSLGFASALPLPIGQTVVITVTVTNIITSTVQLAFLGLRFEWDSPTTWFVGGNSNAGAVLSSGQQIIYNVPVSIPNNVTEGTHRLTAYVTCRWIQNGNWTSLVGGFWISDFPLAHSPQTSTGQGGLLQVFGFETIAALVLAVGIGLFLERSHVKRIIAKVRKTPEKTQSEKPRVEEKKEEDL